MRVLKRYFRCAWLAGWQAGSAWCGVEFQTLAGIKGGPLCIGYRGHDGSEHNGAACQPYCGLAACCQPRVAWAKPESGKPGAPFFCVRSSLPPHSHTHTHTQTITFPSSAKDIFMIILLFFFLRKFFYFTFFFLFISHHC